jgi:RNA polymerase sigma-70 factor (ECF subfamily)
MAAALHSDVVMLIDGGGQAVAPLKPIRGVHDVSVRLLVFLGPHPGLSVAEQAVNGQRGLLVRRGRVVVAVLTLDIRDDRITDVWIVVNPDKLRSFNRE